MWSWKAQNTPWPRAHSAASAASCARGWPGMGKGLKTRFTRPGLRFTKASSRPRSCWQKGHSKSANSTMVTGAFGSPRGGPKSETSSRARLPLSKDA